MGKRSTSRRLAMQILYQVDVTHISTPEAIQNLFEEEQFLEETKNFAKELAEGTLKYKPGIDEIINRLAKDWPIDRISVVDRNILRLAIYELKHETGTPIPVVINEAVELAKKYSTPEAAKFINGILGSVLKEVTQL